MLIIRLQRVGRRNDPNFRMVVVEKKRASKSGAYLETLGSYNPKTKRVALAGERAKYWLSRGAQISATAHNLLVREKIIEAAKINKAKSKVLTKLAERV